MAWKYTVNSNRIPKSTETDILDGGKKRGKLNLIISVSKFSVIILFCFRFCFFLSRRRWPSTSERGGVLRLICCDIGFCVFSKIKLLFCWKRRRRRWQGMSFGVVWLNLIFIFFFFIASSVHIIQTREKKKYNTRFKSNSSASGLDKWRINLFQLRKIKFDLYSLNGTVYQNNLVHSTWITCRSDGPDSNWCYAWIPISGRQ